MGLTIYYSFKTRGNAARAQALLRALHEEANDLPLQGLSRVVDLWGEQCDYHQRLPGDPLRWLLIQAEAITQDGRFRARPLRVIAFTAWPGEGCKGAHFGLCQYPSLLETDEGLVQTGLSDWRWSSFCKTQYAFDPTQECILNFLRCHLNVICLLDKAKAQGCLDRVSDEGGFWESRDLQALAQRVGASHDMVSTLCRRLKGQSGGGTPIAADLGQFASLERLKASEQRRPPLDFEQLAGLLERFGGPNRPRVS